MWSNIYWYYEIRGRADYTVKLPTADVIKVLAETSSLKKISSHAFNNKEGFPWIDIGCFYSTNGSYGNPQSYDQEYCTLLSILGSKSDPQHEQLYVTLLTDIANRLNWEFIVESAGENGEDLVLRAITP